MSTDDLYSRLTELAACLCATIDGGDKMCFCGVMPGSDWYDLTGECEGRCGMAWVRLAGAYPSFTLPTPVTTLQCDAPIALQVEMGVVRCFDAPDSGQAPTAAQLATLMAQQHKDMLDMRKAVLCCDSFDEYIFATWAPIGPEGGIYGGTWGVVVGEF